jgi:hypothetical protein
MNICFILRNEKKISKYFHYFSKKSSKYDYKECEKLYSNLNIQKNGLSIKSLHYYAKNDNYEKYMDTVVKYSDIDLFNPTFTTGLLSEFFV